MPGFQSKNLSIQLFSPLWQGKMSIGSISTELSAWRHSSRAVGGYWDGAFSLRAGWNDTVDWLENGLGRHVELKDEALTTIWEGFVDSIEITSGILEVKIGPLLDMANRVLVSYSRLDTSIEPGIAGDRVVTDPGEDMDSQDRYGILEKYYSAGAITADIADQLRNLYLQRNAYPDPVVGISTTEHEQNIVVNLKGYVNFLDKTVYKSTGGTDTQLAESGFVSIQQKIASAIMAENNDMFDYSPNFVMNELLSNGSFEISGAGGADLFASWVESAGDGTVARVTTDNVNGAVCLSLTAGATKNTHVYQDITVEPGRAYVLTLWTRDLSTETVTGTHTGVDGLAYLEDSAADFKEDTIKVGKVLRNTSDSDMTHPDGSTGTIKSVSKTQITVDKLVGGVQNDFDNGDVCLMVTAYYQGRYRIHDVSNTVDIQAMVETSQVGSSSWHRVRQVFYAPSGCTSVRLYLYCPDTDAKQVYFDTVSIREYNAAIGEHDTFVPAYEDDEQSCWAIIKELVAIGDWENKQYLFGVYADREIKFELAPEVIEYYFAPLGSDQRYYDRGGSVISDWSIQPGKWLALSGFIVGQPIDLNRYTDPRITFIDEVRFSLDLGLTINTSKMNKFQYLLAKAGLKVEE